MDEPRPRARDGVLTFGIRALVLLYWIALAVLGVARLLREGWGSTMAVIHVWYLAALVFLLVWGPATMIASIVTAKGETKHKAEAPKSSGYRLH